MAETFPLPILYRGDELELPLSIVPLGYIYQLHIQLSDRVLIMEKDENREYRVIDNSGISQPVDKGLIQAIITSLNAIQGAY